MKLLAYLLAATACLACPVEAQIVPAPPFVGDGLRCAGGTVTRLGVHVCVMGVTQYPSGGDAPVHVRGGITAPGAYAYQIWYRDTQSFCTPQTFNLTNGFEITWQA